MFAITTLTANTRVIQVTTLVILLAAIVLLALGLVAGDDASAATRCVSPRGC